MFKDSIFRAFFKSDFYQLLTFAFCLPLIFPLILSGNITHMSGSEPFSDYLRYFYYFENILQGVFPLWNPHHNGGIPFYTLVLAQGFNILEIFHAFFFSLLYKLGLEFSLYRAALTLNFLYLFILGAGTMRLLSFFWSNKVVVFVLSILIVRLIGSFWGTDGFYISVLQIYAFFPICYYYFLRIMMEENREKSDLTKFIFCLCLMITNIGIVSIPYFVFFMSHLFVFFVHKAGLHLSGTFYGRILFNKRKLIKPTYIGFLIALKTGASSLKIKGSHFAILFFILSPMILAYLYESSNIIRVGRSLSETTFSDFINSAQGPRGIERILFFLGNRQFPFTLSPYYCGLAVYLIFFIGVFSSEKKSRFLVYCTLFLGSVVFMEYSPMLLLFYKYLFPFLAKVRYWGTFYDLLIFLFYIWTIIGLRNIWERKASSKVVLLSLFLSFILLCFGKLYYGENLAISTSFFFALSALVLLIIIYFPGLSNKRKNQLAYFTFFLFCFDAFYFQYFKNLHSIIDFRGDNQLLALKKTQPLILPKRKESERLGKDKLGNYVFLKKELTYWHEAPFFVNISRMEKTRNALGYDKDRLNRYFGVTNDVLYFSNNFKLSKNEKEHYNDIAKSEKTDIILLQKDQKEKEKTLKAEKTLNSKEKFRVKEYTANHLSFRVSVDQPGFIIWSDGYSPFWKAEVNGHKAPIHLANGNFKAIYLDRKGDYLIEFKFEPPFFKLALMVSILTQCYLIVALYLRPRIPRLNRWYTFGKIKESMT